MYTTFAYDPISSQQVAQIVLEDTTFMTNGSGQYYHPGKDPSVPLTPDIPNLVNFQPAFSPDGNTIAYVQRANDNSMSLYTMPVAEGIANNRNQPAFNPTDPANLRKALFPYRRHSGKLLSGYFVSQPVWSPSGKQLLYYSYQNNHFDIWLATLDKDSKTGRVSMKPGSQVQLTQCNGQLNADSRASWAP
jgi:Tol biopolymer transport system component